MLRKIGILATLLAAVCFSSTAQADVFLTGQTNINGSIQNNGGGVNAPGARNFGLGSNGISFTNFHGNVAGQGGVITAIGFSLLDGSQNTNGTVSPFSSTGSMIGIYALRGVENGQFGASFTEGVIQVFDRTSIGQAFPPGINPLNPSTWNPTNDLVGTFKINNTPINAVLQGPPGGQATEPLVVPNPGAINDATVEVVAGAGTTADFLFSLLGGSLFTQLGANDDFFIRLNQLFQSPTLTEDQLTDLINQLNPLFDALMAAGGFANGGNNTFSYGVGGTVYNPLGGPANGDTIQTNTGGLVVPGQTVPVTEIPEPASLIVWSVMAAGGAGLGMIRRRRNQA